MGIFDETSNAFQLNGELWEYLLVVYPDAPVKLKLVEESNRFYAQYEPGKRTSQDAFILIANFQAKEEMEATFLRWIQNICNLQSSFSVSLNNFSGLPPDTVYLRIQDISPFQKLTASLKLIDGFIQSGNCPAMNLVSKPYLSFTGKLPHHIYNEAIKDYAHRCFHDTFKVDRLVLLKKDALMNCRVLNTFSLPSPLT